MEILKTTKLKLANHLAAFLHSHGFQSELVIIEENFIEFNKKNS